MLDYQAYSGRIVRVAEAGNERGCGWCGVLTVVGGGYSLAVENNFDANYKRVPMTLAFTDADVRYADRFREERDAEGETVRIQLR